MKLRSFTALLLILTLALGLTALAAQFDAAQTITVVSREEGSGTRGAFVELTGVLAKDAAGKEKDNTYSEAIISNGTNLVLTTVADNQAGIGYASLSSVMHNDTVKALKVEGVEASTENILNGTYKIARPFNVVTKGELTDELAIDFMAFVMSKEGQAIVSEDGLVSGATDETPSYEAANKSGSLTVGGSTSVAPVMELLAEAYMELNPEAKIEVQSTGSSAGVTGALDGTYGIGMASRLLKDSEVEKGAQPIVIGNDGIAVVVNLANPVEDITVEQVRQVFTGEVTTWDALSK
ncbi:MAG: phosphate ABC transporter substrate-binding protein [Clostridiales bacterium]|nr:phosphate ABC transporter substrate-binding protein [Clostridiales bacterium]